MFTKHIVINCDITGFQPYSGIADPEAVSGNRSEGSKAGVGLIAAVRG